MKHFIKIFYILGIRIGVFNTFKLLFNKNSKILETKKKITEIEISSKYFFSNIFLRLGTSDIAIFNEVINNEEYDFPIHFEPEYIIDCGANIGLTSLFFNKKFPSAKIYAFEPESSNFNLLSKNTVNIKNIFISKIGIWSKLDELSFEIKTGWDTKVTNVLSENKISVISIGDIMQKYNIPIIDILKIDIEGSEIEVFKTNYENWLPKTKILVIELHNMIDSKISSVFFKALSMYDFEIKYKGENLICFNRKFER